MWFSTRAAHVGIPSAVPGGKIAVASCGEELFLLKEDFCYKASRGRQNMLRSYRNLPAHWENTDLWYKRKTLSPDLSSSTLRASFFFFFLQLLFLEVCLFYHALDDYYVPCTLGSCFDDNFKYVQAVEVLSTLLKKISHKLGTTSDLLKVWKQDFSTVQDKCFSASKGYISLSKHRWAHVGLNNGLPLAIKRGKFLWYSWSRSSAFQSGGKAFCTRGRENWTFKDTFSITAIDGNTSRIVTIFIWHFKS